MSTIHCLLASRAIFSMVLLVGAGSGALAQEKASAPTLKADQVVYVDNDKVKVVENRYKPGAERDSAPALYRVGRALKGGTLQRTYPDGKQETIEWKTDEVRYLEPSGAYRVKNIGKTDVIIYLVSPKK